MFFLRLLKGERYRKATPGELRMNSAVFAFLPVFWFLFDTFFKNLCMHSDAAGIWFVMMVSIVGLILWLALWTRYVPATVSWILGAIIWLAAFWFALTGKI